MSFYYYYSVNFLIWTPNMSIAGNIDGNACFVYCVETCWYCVWSRSVSRILSVLCTCLAICCGDKKESVSRWIQLVFVLDGYKKSLVYCVWRSKSVKTLDSIVRLYGAGTLSKDLSIAFISPLFYYSTSVSVL